jgi:hypothetical protein
LIAAAKTEFALAGVIECPRIEDASDERNFIDESDTCLYPRRRCLAPTRPAAR